MAEVRPSIDERVVWSEQPPSCLGAVHVAPLSDRTPPPAEALIAHHCTKYIFARPISEETHKISDEWELSHLIFYLSIVSAMAEALGVAASAVGIATAAIQSVQFLCKTIDNIKDVPKTVKTVRVDLQAVEPILHRLDKALQNDKSQVVLRDEITPVVENCDRACTSFQAALDGWM